MIYVTKIIFFTRRCLLGWIFSTIFTSVGYDFRIKGISSISIDPHKYGCTPKGISALLYRHTSLRKNSILSIQIMVVCMLLQLFQD